MFVSAMAERDSGRVFLARDRLGIKPRYLSEVGGSLRFASTLPALLTGGGVDTSIDPIGLHHYLSFHSVVPAPRTILAGVSKLPPATPPALEPNGPRIDRPPRPPPFARHPPRPAWHPPARVAPTPPNARGGKRVGTTVPNR